VDVTSSAFEANEPIPQRYTCEGDDLSPPLSWDEPPEGTRSFALVVEDPDAPGRVFTHWVAWGIPGDQRALDEGESAPGSGKNDFGRQGWGGPCPPQGHGPHRYVFRLLALDTAELELAWGGAGKDELERAVEGHLLAEASLVGTYERT
jgi:Raf kinase inhibitor-like YbhB/YbcL family protein